MRFFFMPSIGRSISSIYYARDRWPKYDFLANPPKPATYQVVHKQVDSRQISQGVQDVRHD
jgi:hypothetical protein